MLFQLTLSTVRTVLLWQAHFIIDSSLFICFNLLLFFIKFVCILISNVLSAERVAVTLCFTMSHKSSSFRLLMSRIEYVLTINLSTFFTTTKFYCDLSRFETAKLNCSQFTLDEAMFFIISLEICLDSIFCGLFNNTLWYSLLLK